MIEFHMRLKRVNDMMGLYVDCRDGVWFGVVCDEKRVFATTFGSSKESAIRSLKVSVPANLKFEREEKLSPLAQRVIVALKDVYDGKDVSLEFDFAMERLSEHRQKVMRAVEHIPVGRVSSYGAVAKAVGSGARAVGGVMAANPFAPFCPCHRVVAADCSLGGYGGGLDAKLAFLKRERRGYDSEKEIVVDGKKLRVFPVEWVLQHLAKKTHKRG
jgi:methylated-DNA-[protein]-cysteine S-methyltransferase